MKLYVLLNNTNSLCDVFILSVDVQLNLVSRQRVSQTKLGLEQILVLECYTYIKICYEP